MTTEKKIVSIKDIAKISGVSVATVSRVLNDKGKCSEATRRRVLAVAEQYGYVSNMAAKSLRQAKSNTIGLILPNITNAFFSMIAYSIERQLFHRQYSLFVCNSGNNADNERAYFRTLIGRGVDGILCISDLNELPHEVLDRHIPIVAIDRHPKVKRAIPWVGNNDRQASCDATALLIRKGCRHIAFISGYFAEYNHTTRQAGYQQALSANGIPFDRNLVIERSGKDPTHIEVEVLVYECIKQGHPIDGIVASSEPAGIGALFAVKNAGLSVPEDIKLICFDNSPISVLTSPALSSIERNPDMIAAKSCELLLKLIDGEEPEETDIYVPTSLIDRSSTKA